MDTLKTIWEDFSDRFKSPFVVSFLLSWLVWNWLLVYSVFNFDSSWSMFAKQIYIEQYIKDHNCNYLTFYPLFSSILVALFFYFFKAVFLAMDTLYENRLRVLVIKAIGVAEMIPKSDLDRYSKEISLLHKELNTKNTLFESSKTEIMKLTDENEKHSDYSTIKQDKEKLEEEKKVIKIDIPDIVQVFNGIWICEFQFHPTNDKGVVEGIEHFTVSDNKYYVEKRLEFSISNIVKYENDVVEFQKNKIDNPFSFSKTKITKVYDNYWIGFELNNEHKYSFVRYYPNNFIPEHLLKWIENDDLIQDDTQYLISRSSLVKAYKLLLK